MNGIIELEMLYEQVQENKIIERLLNEQNEVLKDLATKFKQAKEAGNQQELDILRPQITTGIADMFKPEAEEAVKMFEGDSLKTTRGNYGKYMQFLSDPQLKGLYLKGMIQALKNAGAGQGLSDALRVMYGN